MAKKRLKIKDKQGNVVDFDISSASVTIDAEGKSLDVKLSELVAAIASAVKSVTFNGQVKNIDANGNVNLGQQMNPNWSESNPNYPSFIQNKPSIPSRTSQLQNDSGYITADQVPSGETDSAMSPTSERPVQNKVIKAYVDNLINGLLDGAPAALDTLKELSAALGNNADFASTITQQLSTLQPKLTAGTGISISGDTISVDAEVVQPATPDGTFTIRIGGNTYTINLNHTHEGMAKLVVDTAANLPDASEMESDTIYGELDDGEIATIYLGGYPFYGGGGGSTEPALRQPADGSVIDLGEYESGSLEATVKVKGRKLTEALTVEIDGTGFAFAQTQPSGVTVVSTTELTVTAEAANTLSGVDIAVVYTGTQYNAQGTFGVSSSEVSCECVIRASYITLPSGYTACEYIANGATINNNIYINTGVDVTSSLRVVGKYKVAPSNEWQALFGMYLNDNAHYRCMSGTNTYPIIFMIKGSSFGTAYRVADTSPHEFDVSKERLIFDGVEYQSEASSEWTTDKKLYLFSMNNASNNNASEGAMPNCRVYYFKMYNGSSLVRNFRPAYEQSTQKYGMYDLVHGVFYPSSGSGNFSGQQIS